MVKSRQVWRCRLHATGSWPGGSYEHVHPSSVISPSPSTSSIPRNVWLPHTTPPQLHPCPPIPMQVDALDVTCGQLRSEPLLDTRQLLEAMLLDPFFPNLPPPPPPPPAAPHAHPHAHLLPTARVAEALHASRLRAHVEGVRRALGGTGLWGDRPPLLEVLAAKQHAALSDEYDVAAGKDR